MSARASCSNLLAFRSSERKTVHITPRLGFHTGADLRTLGRRVPSKPRRSVPRRRLGRCPDVVPASELGDHSYVAYLTVENVDDYYARAISERAEVLKAPTDEPWGRREMGLRSPDGHRFMLGERIQQLGD